VLSGKLLDLHAFSLAAFVTKKREAAEPGRSPWCPTVKSQAASTTPRRAEIRCGQLGSGSSGRRGSSTTTRAKLVELKTRTLNVTSRRL
jgi:hypothetical protein